jgi:hypothetical protein
MSYTHDRTITDASIDDVDGRIRKALGERGFGVPPRSTSRPP